MHQYSNTSFSLFGFSFDFVKTVFRDTQNQSLAAENLDGIPIPEHSLSMSTNYLPYSRRTRAYFFFISFSHCQVYEAVFMDYAFVLLPKDPLGFESPLLLSSSYGE